MSASHNNDYQFNTETGASSTGNGDGEWKEIRGQRKGGSPSASGDSRASKSTVPTKVIVVPSGQAPGAVSWVRKYWKGSKMEAHLKGWNDKGRKTSKILLVGAEADKCGKVLLAKVKNWSEQKGKVASGTYTSPSARPVHTLIASQTVGKSALFKAKDGSPVKFHPAKVQDESSKTFKFSLSGGSKSQQEAVLATATELAHQMSCVVRLPAPVAGLAIKMTQQDYKDNTGGSIDIERHRYTKDDEFHYAYVLSSDEGLVEALHGALEHFAAEVSAKNAEFLRKYQAGKFALVPEKEVLKKQRWNDRYTITKTKFLPAGVAKEHHPKEGFAFVMFPDTEKGAKCLKKARDLTKRYLDKKSEEAKSGGSAAKKTSSPPKAYVSAEDYFATKAKSKGKTEEIKKSEVAEAPAEEKVFKSGGMFDGLAEEADVDPARTEATVVPKGKKSPKTVKKLVVTYNVGSTPETVRERTQEKRDRVEKEILAEAAREECSAQFAEVAKTAAPMGSAWSAMAAKAKVEKKVEQVELPAPVAFLSKHPKKVETVGPVEEEQWQVQEDYDHWTPPATPVGYGDEEEGGW